MHSMSNSFHGLKAVAPLRHQLLVLPLREELLSTASRPWPHCGSVEARQLVPERVLSTASRPWPHCGMYGQVAGRDDPSLSTASRPWPHCGHDAPGGLAMSLSFPRPQGRGPIAAAGARAARRPVRPFPRPQGRGPIAAFRLVPTSYQAKPFPRPQGRGPIAAGHDHAPAQTELSLSTASRPWPHCGVNFPGGVFLAGGLSTASRPWPHCGLCDLAPGHRILDPFHGLKAVAPLRQLSLDETTDHCPSFHGLKAVAPLRQHAPAPATSPRHLSTASRPWPHCGTLLPRGTPGQADFPRPQGRGPIAAGTTTPCLRRRLAFHGLKAVAPLRPAAPRCPPRAAPLSTASRPWPHCGAELRQLRPDARALSTASRPWPHCGDWTRLAALRHQALSTASRPWPHCGQRVATVASAVAQLSTASRP